MIELINTTLHYPNHVTALQNVTLTVDTGEFVFVVGTSGAGKSTFLKLLYREARASEGVVRVFGQDVSTLKNRDIPHLRRRIGIVFQDFGLLADRTAYENIAYALRVTGVGRREIRSRVNDVLELVGLSHRPDAYPHQLSGGEQQRIAIARALVHEPPLLLADEPTGNLDPDTSAGIIELLRYIHSRGTTVLIATHEASLVDRFRQRVMAFEAGRLVRDQAQGHYHRPAEAKL